MKKQILIPSVLLLVLGLVCAVVYLQTISVTATVSEAISSSTISLDFSGMPGETILQNIAIQNDASVPLNVEIIFNETDNVNGVTYTSDMPQTISIAPGLADYPVSITYDTDTVAGDISGDIILNRVA